MAGSPEVVAVAGGTGFVGGAIARELASRGHRVLIVSHRRDVPATLRDSTAGRLVEMRKGDVTQPATLPDALRGATALVIALAFHNYPVEAPRRGQTFERVDAAGTEALVHAAKAAGVGRVIYMSGAGAAAEAKEPWFRAKWRAEEAVRSSGLTYTIFRPSWIYGPGDRSLNRFIGFTRWLPFVPQIGNGRQRLAPVFIDDMAALVADSLETPGGTECGPGSWRTRHAVDGRRDTRGASNQPPAPNHPPRAGSPDEDPHHPTDDSAISTDEPRGHRFRRAISPGGYDATEGMPAPPTALRPRGPRHVPGAEVARVCLRSVSLVPGSARGPRRGPRRRRSPARPGPR